MIGIESTIMYKQNLYIALLVLFAFSSVFAQQELKNNLGLTDKLNMESENPIDFEKELERERIKQQQDSIKNISKFFGYRFLIDNDTTAFNNMPAPSNYLIGSGDQLIISLWGETQLRKTYTVSKDGKIYDDKVGLMTLSGKNINELNLYLYKQFERVYSTLSGSKPSTFFDVSLGELKTINVNFVGEFVRPGVYPISPFSNLITGIIQAGGIDTTGSLRNISIKRNRKTFSNVDLYDYLLKGDLPNKIQLRDQDVVFVPVRFSSVIIDSAVYRPGVYESKSGESIKTLIDYAGGIKPNASEVIEIKRIVPISKRMKGSGISKENYYFNYSDSEKTVAQDGDTVIVKTIFESINQVEILGQVKRPGKYSYQEGMSLYDLLKISSGFEDESFLSSVSSLNAELIRIDPQSSFEKIIKINLFKSLDDNQSIALKNMDKIIIHQNPNYAENKVVQITGEIAIPGHYTISPNNITLKNLLEKAGGLTADALKEGITIDRDREVLGVDSKIVDEENGFIRLSWKNTNIKLMPGDSIHVKKKSNTVFVTGEVNLPGLVEFKTGRSLNYYLNSAGGLINKSSSINVIHPNGSVKTKNFFISPRVHDGSIIIVLPRETEQRFNLTQFATNWTQIISSMITVYLLTQQISGN